MVLCETSLLMVKAIYETFSLKSNNLSPSKLSSDHMIMSVYLFSNLCVWWSCVGWVLGTHCATDCSLTSFVTKELFVCLFCSCRVTFATSCCKKGESSALLCGEAVALLPITDPASWSSCVLPNAHWVQLKPEHTRFSVLHSPMQDHCIWQLSLGSSAIVDRRKKCCDQNFSTWNEFSASWVHLVDMEMSQEKWHLSSIQPSKLPPLMAESIKGLLCDIARSEMSSNFKSSC